ncbi:MAG: ABC transporter ATP-binding protein, partial [Bifidobacteriaceae bacterium]|jgi:peptide/nickel transport system ATP-binding protein|nr:ABC transporter ATP-binding protein [Bifidobacteriaceae bacterium]
VLSHVSLAIPPGEILGVVGRSGSGKSVLALTLLGLLPKTARPQLSGRAVVAGVDMVSAGEQDRRRVRRTALGAVFQDPMTSLNPTMRVGRQIKEAAWTKRTEAAIELMSRVSIPQPGERLRSFPHQLSGGLRQRVMVAMAIADQPQLVIADEPTTALDTTVQAQVLATLGGLRDAIGCSIVLITHDLGVAAQVADRIAVIYRGEIVELGSSQAVLEAPQHPYTKSLLASRLTLTVDKTQPLRVESLETADGAPEPGHGTRPGVGETEAAAAARPQPPAPTPAPPGVPAAQTGAPAPPAVSLQDVECVFTVSNQGRKAKLHALRGVTLDVAEGESLAIVGESGSGKSTLLRCVAGLETGFTGRLTAPPRADIQMVFQDAGASLTPWLSARAMLRERLRGHGTPGREASDLIAQALDRVGLPAEILDVVPSEMSGGQRQRVALARATIVPPKVLLCDEPTSALDVSLAAQVLNLLRGLRRALGTTMLFVTHDLAVARFIADRIAVMYLGRLVEVGPAEQVIGAPAHPYTQALVAAIPGAKVPFPEVQGESASPLDPPPGCAYHPRCPLARPACANPALALPLDAFGEGRWLACPVVAAEAEATGPAGAGAPPGGQPATQGTEVTR